MKAAYLFLSFVVITASWAQTPVEVDTFKIKGNRNGKIDGTIVNWSDKTPLLGVQVTLLKSNHKTVTDSNGAFTFVDIKPSKYSMRIEKQGYLSRTITGITVLKGLTLPMTLSIPRLGDIDTVGFIDCYPILRDKLNGETQSIHKWTNDDIKHIPGN
jgi:hypothetical protein